MNINAIEAQNVAEANQAVAPNDPQDPPQVPLVRFRKLFFHYNIIPAYVRCTLDNFANYFHFFGRLVDRAAPHRPQLGAVANVGVSERAQIEDDNKPLSRFGKWKAAAGNLLSKAKSAAKAVMDLGLQTLKVASAAASTASAGCQAVGSTCALGANVLQLALTPSQALSAMPATAGKFAERFGTFAVNTVSLVAATAQAVPVTLKAVIATAQLVGAAASLVAETIRLGVAMLPSSSSSPAADEVDLAVIGFEEFPRID
jgi:hypothetical protein